jgi:ParB family chromosome partitioning protein
MVEATILLAASRHNGTNVLKDAATLYKVDTEAIGQKVKQEFAAKAKAKKEPKPEAKPVAKAKKAAWRSILRGAAHLPPLVFFCAQNARRHGFGFSLHPRSRLYSGPARRLRGRTTFRVCFKTNPKK